MGSKLASYIDQTIFFLLMVVAGVTPLLFTSLTTDFYETPKLIFLAAVTLLLIGLWTFSWVVKGKISIQKTPLDLPLLFILGIVLASTFFSTTRYQAIFGGMTRMHGTAISWVVYTLLYFVTVSNIKSKDKIQSLLYVLLGSGMLVALVSIFSFFRLFLPVDIARSVNFSPTGSTFSAMAMMLLLLPIPLVSIVKPNKFLPLPVALTAASVMGMAVALIGTLPGIVVMAIVFILSMLTVEPANLVKRIPLVLVPAGLTAVLLLITNVAMPGNILQQTHASFPREIQLPLGISWKVTASAFRDAPFIGTGPATYLYNFTAYKPLEFNLLNYWNIAFDNANNEFLQVLGTTGILGLLGLIFVSFIAVKNGWKHINAEGAQGWLAVSAITAVLLLFIHSMTLVSLVLTLFVLAAFLMSVPEIAERTAHVSLGLKASTADNKQFDLFPFFVFVLFLIAAVPAVFKSYNVVAADFYHRKALVEAGKSGTTTYTYLQKSEVLNPYIDLYRVDLAQTNFALANAIASQASGSAGLTDSQKQTIQTLLSQAITEGRVSVTLSPRSSRNWEVLGSIYRNISGVAQNSLTFALDAYGKAIQRDPVNPALRVTVGGIYYSAKNYDMTIRFFSDAVNLKPDYVNAYYNLAIALRDKGDLANAKLIADQAVNILQKDPSSPDYKTAKALADDLNSRIAAAKPENPPAANAENALNSAGLKEVNVPEIQNPPEVSTPSAVKPNPNAVLPQTTPTPAPVQ